MQQPPMRSYSQDQEDSNVEKLIGIKEAAELLDTTPATLYTWVHQRRVPFIKLGGTSVKFKPSQLERWSDRQQQEELNVTKITWS